MKYDKVIFVGNENTCRSPMAEALFLFSFEEEECPCEIVSRGLVVLFEEPYNQKAEMILYNHGLETREKMAIQLTEEDLQGNPLILTMGFTDKLKIIEDYNYEGSVYTLKEYVGNDDELLDPYGEEMDIYEACYQDIYQVIGLVKEKFITEMKESEEEEQ